MNTLVISAAISALLPELASPEGFDGAFLSIERFSYSQEFDGETDFYGSSVISFGGEFGLGSAFGLSADLTNYGGDINDSAGTLHGFYRFGQETAIGAFYGYDSARVKERDLDTFETFAVVYQGTFYGIEGV